MMSLNQIVEKLVAGRWIAGESIADAIYVAKVLNTYGITAQINYLGEAFTEKSDVEKTVKTYRSLIDVASREKIKFSIALKLTELGLLINKSLALKNYSALVSYARSKNVFVFIDMEEHEYIDDTIRIYETEVKKGSVGICIQSYTRRSQDDIKRLVKKGAVIRLVKGAYKENDKIAYQTRQEITQNYIRLMDYLFKNSKRFMIATHDEEIISNALLQKKKSKADVSFEMLKGIRNKRAFELRQNGEDVSVYLPFGPKWIQYASRRLREAENIGLVLRSLFD